MPSTHEQVNRLLLLLWVYSKIPCQNHQNHGQYEAVIRTGTQPRIWW